MSPLLTICSHAGSTLPRFKSASSASAVYGRVNLDREIAAPADPFRAVGEYLRFSALYITLE